MRARGGAVQRGAVAAAWRRFGAHDAGAAGRQCSWLAKGIGGGGRTHDREGAARDGGD